MARMKLQKYLEACNKWQGSSASKGVREDFVALQ